MLNKLHIADMNTCNKLNAKLEYLDAFPRNFTPPCFSVTQDSVTYVYVIEHKDSFLIVNIESSVEASYEILWNRAVVLLKLYKLLRGYFPEFKSLSFYLKVNDNKEIKINLNDKCLHNMIHRYTTEDCYKKFDFYISLQNNFEEVFKNWAQLNNNYGFSFDTFCGATSSYFMPKDISIALIIQLFEEIHVLYENTCRTQIKAINDQKTSLKNHIKKLIDNDNSWIDSFTKEEVKNFICGSIKKYFKTEEGTLRACLRQAISSYGDDIFEKEYKTKQPDDFHKLLVESRNRVFHVDGSKQNILQDIEYTAYNMKLSILYRRIMTAKILPEFKYSTDVQRYYIKLIDKWVDQNSK